LIWLINKNTNGFIAALSIVCIMAFIRSLSFF
jgi:hypothetical protein